MPRKIRRALRLLVPSGALLLAQCGDDITQPVVEMPVTWSIVHPTPPSFDLQALWSDGRGTLCGVGRLGALLRRDAHGWHQDRFEEVPQFVAVGGTGPRDLFAVGFPGDLYHYDGRAWSLHTEGAKTSALSAAPGGLYLMGPWAFLRWDDEVWTPIAVELTCTAPSGYVCIGPTLQDVWAAGADEAFAVADDGSVLHLHGAVSDTMPVPVHRSLRAIWGASARDVYAAGDGGLLLHYTGTDWSVVDLGTQENLVDVAGTGPADVHVLGTASVHDFDGAGWTHTALAARPRVAALACTGAGLATIVGSRGVLYELASGTWSRLVLPPAELVGLCVLADGEAFAVGDSGMAVHAKGTEFTFVATGVVERLWSVAGARPDHVIAVGEAGRIVRFDGSSWRPEPTTVDATLFGAWVAPNDEVFAVGMGGTIVHFDGTAWQSMSSGSDRSLWAVHGTAANQVVAVGEEGTVLRFDGVSWSSMTSPSTLTLIEVSMQTDGTLYAMEEFGRVLAWDGTEWRDSHLALDGATATSLCVVDEGDVYVTAWRTLGWGHTSTVHRFDGDTWSTEKTGTGYPPFRVRGSSARQLRILTMGGMILQRDASTGD